MVARQRFDERRVLGRRPAAQLMIDVHHTQPEVPVLAQFEEDMEQAYRIRSAAHGRSGAVAARKHPMAQSRLEHAIEHYPMLRRQGFGRQLPQTV